MKLIQHYQNIHNLLSSLFLISVLLFLQACAVNPVSGKKDFVLISEDQEIVMGKQAHTEINQQYPAYANGTLQNYVNAIGQPLASKSHRNQLRYTFTVVDSPEINAFALPGGYVYITRGLMAYLNSEAELAGVLGHEIGHVTARHGVRQQSIGTAADLVTSVLSDKFGREKIFNTVSTFLTRGYGRNQELEADRLGAEYLAKVGYAPEYMIRVVETLKAQEEYSRRITGGSNNSVYHGLFSTHPSNDKRLQQVILAAKRFPSAGKKSPNRDAYLQKISGLPFSIGNSRVSTIKLIRVKLGETFLGLANGNQKYAELLRLLNGMYPNGKLKTGQLIKVLN